MRKLIVMQVLILGFIGITAQSVLADAQTESSNPSTDEIKQLISDEARERGIPPEILKAIAYVETGYQQYNSDGTPYISDDCGIGILQVTPEKIDIPVDTDRLKTDMEYNIEIGAQVLENKWNLDYLPKLNNHDKTNLEDWYFAIMAYNGLSKTNDPNIQPDHGEERPYQEKVYDRMEGSSLIYWDKAHFIFPTFDIRYDGNNAMKFPDGKNYQTKTITPSQQMYDKGDIVYVDKRDGSVSLHEGSIDGPVNSKLWPFTPLTIASEPVESSSTGNDFAYYKVKGVTAEGYMASAYLNEGSKEILFNDPMDDKRAAALAFAAMNGYVQGYPNGDFGSGDSLKREHVAVILDNILSLSAPGNYQMVADDVEKDNPYYEQLAEAEFNKYLGGGGKLRPKEYFTRSQMAQVMTEAFDTHYKQPEDIHTFKDQENIWNPDAVNTIYSNDVTVADPFNPNDPITRSQFAIFIYRTMVDY
ncbi:S-layer homology domain-containing protein [Lentibacillus sp. Marseille-P4043]|uniref:S-layer homology domain-containing protein n=1 Tax=Lentibacillus sp. Marseille-P4043 TaxID=2040293 RepID=UPI000D0B1BCC|nr:S-layer homology domain-containing protein [Lentibacillus sp. Marseille-P4043]